MSRDADSTEVTSPALEREVRPGRRRLSVGMMSVGLALAAGAVLGRPPVIAVPAPAIVIEAGPQEVAVCEHPVAVAIEVAPEPVPPSSPPPTPPKPIGEPLSSAPTQGPLIGVAVASGAAHTVAVWSETAVVISDDAGETFRPMALGDVRINSVAVSPSGQTHVITVESDDSLRLTTAGTKTSAARETKLPMASVLSLHATRDHLVVHSLEEEGALWISSDHGDTWRRREAPSGNFNNELHVGEDGTIQLVIGSEAGCGGGHQGRYATTIEGTEWRELDWPLDVPVGMQLGPNLWTYGSDEDCGERGPGLCAVGPDGDVRNVFSLEDSPTVERFASNRQISLAVVGDQLIRLRNRRMMRLGKAPDHLEALAVDQLGRAFAIRRGTLIRRDDKQWRSLFPTRATLELFAHSTKPD